MDSQPSTVLLQAFLADPKNRETSGKFAAKYQPRIKQSCKRRGLQDADADDLAATILLRFCERDVFDGFVFQSKDKFNGWLDTVARNAVLTFLRDRGRKPDAWSVGNPDAQESLHQVMVRDLQSVCEEDRTRVEAAFAAVKMRVKDETFLAFWESVIERRKAEEVAKALGMRTDGVYTAVSRVKRLLRNALSDLHEARGEQK